VVAFDSFGILCSHPVLSTPQIFSREKKEVGSDGCSARRLDAAKNAAEHFLVLIKVLVEAAGIEPASASPPHTGDYMLSLSFI